VSDPPAVPGYRALLRTYLGPQWRRVVVLALVLLAAIALQLASPQILRRFVDGATAGEPLGGLVVVALVYLAAALALQGAQLGETYVAENVGLVATNRLRADLTLHVLRLDPAYLAAHPPGELIERTDGDVAALGNFFSRLVVYLIGNGLLLVGVLALLFGVDWRVGLIALFCTVLAVVWILALRGVAIARNAEQRQASADLFGLIEERLAGLEDVRANGGVPYVLYRLLERTRRLVWRGVAAQAAGAALYHGAVLLLWAGTIGALAAAIYLFRHGGATIGTVYLVVAYSQSLRRPVEGISRQLQDLQQAAASIGRVRSLLAERSSVADGQGGRLPPGPLSVEADRVTFAYPDGEEVLSDLSFRLEPGQVLGVLGRTGSGKTTIARLLFRLYDPTAGTIRLGGVDLRQPRIAELRRRVGVVSQDVQLFHATVRDNVTFFDPAVPDDRVVAVLEWVGLGAWLGRQPRGLDTLLRGAGGLSAGEAQLLAFARVYLKDPGLVILDEASSRLDPATERLLERAVDRLLTGRTVIVIAHRLATVERADRILVLEDGRVVEEGDRAGLAADPRSRFAGLLRVGLEDDGVLA
jgi:ATP-binding cassette subfamily B protein